MKLELCFVVVLLAGLRRSYDIEDVVPIRFALLRVQLSDSAIV
jgi:hypothetical protein